LFTGAGRSEQMDTTSLTQADVDGGIPILDVLEKTALIPSRGEGKRLIKQNGIYLNDDPVPNFNYEVTADDFNNGEAILRKGKKVYHRLVIDD